MTVAVREVDRVVAFVHEAGLELNEDERKWDHMGALIVDAALQPRTRYKATVWPRARRIRDEWPDARTTTGLRARLESVDLPTYLAWRRTSPKITKIYDLAAVMGDLGVDTVDDLAERFRDPALERATRQALRRVNHVGPKTLDYLAILTGSNNHVAVDQHIATFVRNAGVRAHAYEEIGGIMRTAADVLGCSPGALDAAIWNHLSTRNTGGPRAC
ncbi:hypothetical protein ACWEQV_20915 [Rhodococcus aetherivorans]